MHERAGRIPAGGMETLRKRSGQFPMRDLLILPAWPCRTVAGSLARLWSARFATPSGTVMRIAVLPLLALSLASPVAAQVQAELPSRRPGYWEIRVMTGGGPGGQEMTIQTCTDAATERQMVQFGFGQMGQTCQRYDIRREGGDIVVDTDCATGPVRTTARSVISGNLQSTYSMRIEGTIQTHGDPDLQRTLIVQEGRWVSARCGGGLVPGDILLPGGRRLNIRNMPGLAQQEGQAPRP
jgi:hypothetical protein